jgi:hypothetical protein
LQSFLAVVAISTGELGEAMRHHIWLLLMLAMAIFAATAMAEEYSPRRKPPSPAQADQIASDVALNDSLLRKGDIVVTDRGFFVFRGIGADGISNDFVPVPNPMPRPAKVV